MDKLYFDPKIFIRKPYWDCPKCKASKSYGVLMIGGNHYTRRCRECWYSSTFELPKLNKKIVYLDQFAISNMEKILNPKVQPEKKLKIDSFWLDLFKKLDSLCKLQLIICPDSITHMNESVVTQHYKALKRMYELLSHATRFYDFETIERFQLCEYARSWIKGLINKEVLIDASTIVYGNINCWQERLIITAEQEYPKEEIQTMKQNKEKNQGELNELFESWREIRQFDFEKQLEMEILAYGQTKYKIYVDYICEYAKVYFGFSSSINNLLNTEILALVESIKEIFIGYGLDEDESQKKTWEYLTSIDINYVPFIKISSLLYAALARKAASGQKKAPNVSFFNDVRTISSLLPYCDAMFLDNECASLLNEEPLKTRITYGTKVFSLNTRKQFLTYLDNIEDSVPEEHFNKVKEVYGEDWPEPYITLYVNEKY